MSLYNIYFFSFSLAHLISFIRSLSGGELFERITAEGYTMSEAEVINYMRQICEGVKHMHEKNIIHLGERKIFSLPWIYVCNKKVVLILNSLFFPFQTSNLRISCARRVTAPT